MKSFRQGNPAAVTFMKRLVTYKRQTHSKEKSKVFQTNKVDDDAKLQVHSCCAEEEKKLSQYHCRNEMCSSGRVFDQRGFNTTMASCTSLDTSYTSMYHLSNVSNSVPVVISLSRVQNMPIICNRGFNEGNKCSSLPINTRTASSTSLYTSSTSISHHPNVSTFFPHVLSLPRVHNLRNCRVERRQWLPIGVNENYVPTQRNVNHSIIYATHDCPNQG